MAEEYSSFVFKLVNDLLRTGLVQDERGKDFLEGVLHQTLNDCEAQRQRCLRYADDLRREIVKAEAQANTYSQFGSIIFAVMNGYVQAADSAVREVEELKASENPNEPDPFVVQLEEEVVEEEEKPVVAKKKPVRNGKKKA